MAHTPGPWKTGGMITRVEVTPKGWRVPMCIADCHTTHAPEDEAERCANARLIAAAPVMLEALEACQVRLFVLDGACPEYERAAEAISLARGETTPVSQSETL